MLHIATVLLILVHHLPCSHASAQRRNLWDFRLPLHRPRSLQLVDVLLILQNALYYCFFSLDQCQSLLFSLLPLLNLVEKDDFVFFISIDHFRLILNLFKLELHSHDLVSLLFIILHLEHNNCLFLLLLFLLQKMDLSIIHCLLNLQSALINGSL